MIDLHTHSILSDGALIPSELARRAFVAGYKVLAITDHADESNLEWVISNITNVCASLNSAGFMRVIPGVELTHIPPQQIGEAVKRARTLGAKVVVGHGETLAEPVAPGTNAAYIRAQVDVLAHPGLITHAECALAGKNSVCLEITSRHGHSISNGHVADAAIKGRARLVLNSDTHCPGDLLKKDYALSVALGAGLKTADFKKMLANSMWLAGRADAR